MGLRKLDHELCFIAGAIFGSGLFVADLVFGSVTQWLMGVCR